MTPNSAAHHTAYLASLNQIVLDDLADKEREIDAREAAANKVIEECHVERRSITAQRKLIQDAEALQLEAIGKYAVPAPDAAADGQTTGTMPEPVTRADVVAEQTKPRKLRARIGPQRYELLSTLRDAKPLSVDELEVLTPLSERRIKDQLRGDLAAGIVREVAEQDGRGPSRYELTALGHDLLLRFVSYRKARGLPLPTDNSSDLEAA